jgi:tetratricopeptide (TPR) repeat protein
MEDPMWTRTAAAIIVLTGGLASATAQTPADRERAQIQNRLGWISMQVEDWEKAAKSFQQAIEFDPEFELAYYGMGRANLALRRYAEAISSLVKCRDLYVAHAGRQFSNVQEAQRYRSNRLTELDELIRQVQTGPQSSRTQDMLRQLQNTRREVQEAARRGIGSSLNTTAPAYVSLSLGSAYFRAGQLADAEREYKAAVEADNKSGEAYQNLAVVYLETGRFADAELSIKAAKKVGFRVNPQLEEDINKKRRGGSY